MGVDKEKGACGDGDGDECGSIDMADISTRGCTVVLAARLSGQKL